MRDYPSNDDARTANTAAEVNTDHRNPSNDPLEPSNPDELHDRSESLSSHGSRGEHVASGSGQSNPVGEQSAENPSDEDDEDEDAAYLEFLKINPEFIVHRQQYTDALENAGLNELPEGNWQDTFEGVWNGDVIMYQKCEFVREYPLNDEDLSWAPVPFGHMRTTIEFVILEHKRDESINVHHLMAFDDIQGHPKRGQEAFDDLYGEMHYALGEYVHVVAVDSDGPIRSEPECFEKGVQCNWRSINDAPPPSNKNWFASVEMALTMRNQPVCIVGEVGRSEDFEILNRVRKEASDAMKKAGDQVIQLRRAEGTRNFTTGAKCLDRKPESPSSAVEDHGQGPMYEDRDYVDPERYVSVPWSYDDIDTAAEQEEIQRRKADETHDSLVAAMADSPDSDSESPSSAVDDRSERYTYEDRDYVDPKHQSNAPWDYDD